MKVYLSGPMTGYPEHNFPAFAAAREELRADGLTVLCPAEAGTVHGWDWAQYLKRDLALLFQAEAVVVLPGWRDSKGAALEVYVARQFGYPIRDFGGHHDLLEGEQA